MKSPAKCPNCGLLGIRRIAEETKALSVRCQFCEHEVLIERLTQDVDEDKGSTE